MERHVSENEWRRREVAQRGSDKHLHYSRGVTVEEMRQAAIAVMQLVPTESVVNPGSRDRGRDGGGRDRIRLQNRLG